MPLRRPPQVPFPPGRPPDLRGEGQLFWLHDIFVLAALLIVVIAAVVIVRMLIRRPARVPMTAFPNHAALGELDVRYARGESSREEYLQRRADLLSPNLPAAAAPGAVNPAPPA